MIEKSLKIRLLVVLSLGLVMSLSYCRFAFSAETPPVPYRSAPIIPWAKKIGEHRFRSPRRYDDTLKYYRKIFGASPYVQKMKIINTSEVRAVHYKNKRTKARWEGLNIYEYKGVTTIFVVFSDKELKKIAAEGKGPKKTPKVMKPRQKR
jgi:hypothetical protein